MRPPLLCSKVEEAQKARLSAAKGEGLFPVAIGRAIVLRASSN
jgi:hypothetical protein